MSPDPDDLPRVPEEVEVVEPPPVESTDAPPPTSVPAAEGERAPF